MARILTAIAPDAEERIRWILKGHELIVAGDLAEATNALEEEAIELIFVGARFERFSARAFSST